MNSSPSKRHSLSTIESSVTRLLVATKHLLESLTQWSKHAATESDISDAYVQLGNEFKVACRAFSNAGVDVSDLGDVPHALRVVLEEALCEEPSQESLDKFLPSIREIIVTLLQNLKTKQSVAKTLKANKSRESLKRTSSNLHERKTSINSSKKELPLPPPPPHNAAASTTTNSSATATPEPVIAVTPSTPDISERTTNDSSSSNNSLPVPNDALAQLQKGDSLQRRASRRFSAYQYAKLTSYSPGRDPELPDQSIIERSKTLGKSPLNNVKNNEEKKDNSTVSVFLKVGDKVKKSTLNLPITFTSLRLLFIEKFAYSPGSGTFPDIYIQDQNGSIFYELEESNFNDITDGVVISLKIENENKELKELKDSLITRQDEIIDKLQKKYEQGQFDLLDKIETLIKTSTPQSIPIESSSTKKDIKPKEFKSKLTNEITDLKEIRHELGIIKQINNQNKTNFKDSINSVLLKVSEFKSLSISTSNSSNRNYMESSNSKLSKDSDLLLTKFDDLQDMIEALRKDVATRGSRPSQKRIDSVSKEIQIAQDELNRMVNFISTEKPNWKKIWENELDTVCQEQQFLTLQEDLTLDLKEDLEKAIETFDLVKQCCVEQSKNPKFRPTNLPLASPGSLPDLRDALLSQVEALNPNHENRVEAIERAEKLREKERELLKLDGFEEELDDFVNENKLKKSGGIEEVERIRKLKDEENLRSAFPPLY